MGGRIWSDQEERYFWRVAIARSIKRVGADVIFKKQKSWPELAIRMQAALGKDARREYTQSMLFEHYFQNIKSQRVSPNAGRYVREFLRKAGLSRGHHFLDVHGAAAITASQSNRPQENAKRPSGPGKAGGGAFQPNNKIMASPATTATSSSDGELLSEDYLENSDNKVDSE
ncbi:hypothetical protein SUNI508_09809 [Seiridium unicorne]|uniref:Uncharacterized protein n=1 Tax=Seiridium unicorne TaxID=138068 RepID=A0ABR2UP05_9PEZI